MRGDITKLEGPSIEGPGSTITGRSVLHDTIGYSIEGAGDSAG
jgi:hypothetical protein